MVECERHRGLGRERRYAAIATDLRFVVLLATHRILDWEKGARGGVDYWVRADELVRKRRSGETNSKSLVPSVVEHYNPRCTRILPSQ